ncbi:MAG: hypothetical protein KGI71_06520 [Patescibacteria group bacterium]|nr:hypothetical protein [Patescibacteria group bacterium]
MASATGPVDFSQFMQQLLSGGGGGGDPTVGGAAAGIMDLIRGVKGTDVYNAQTAAGYADPFASQRGQYQKQLQGLLTDPNSFQMDPGTQFAENQALQAVGRQGNSMFGTTRSGNTAQALEQTAAGYGAQAYNTRIQQLMQMSGANNMFGPSEAGRIMAGGYANQNQSLAGGLQGGLNGLLTALFGKGGSTLSGAAGGISGLLSQLFGGNGGNTDMTGFNTGGSATDIFNQLLSGGTTTSPSMDNINQMLSGVNGADFSSLWGGIGGSSPLDLTGLSGGGDGSGGTDFSSLWGGVGGP